MPAGARFAILATRWNPGITDPMLAAARETLRAHGVAEADTDVLHITRTWIFGPGDVLTSEAGGKK